MREAASDGAAVVACTCSTIGGIAERTATGGAFTAQRIDRAMAERAVRAGPRVLIAAALESTLEPTTALILSTAAQAGAGKRDMLQRARAGDQALKLRRALLARRAEIVRPRGKAPRRRGRGSIVAT